MMKSKIVLSKFVSFENIVIKNLHFDLLPKIQEDFLKNNIGTSLVLKTFSKLFKEKENEYDSYLNNIKSKITNCNNLNFNIESGGSGLTFKNNTIRAKINGLKFKILNSLQYCILSNDKAYTSLIFKDIANKLDLLRILIKDSLHFDEFIRQILLIKNFIIIKDEMFKLFDNLEIDEELYINNFIINKNQKESNFFSKRVGFGGVGEISEVSGLSSGTSGTGIGMKFSNQNNQNNEDKENINTLNNSNNINNNNLHRQNSYFSNKDSQLEDLNSISLNIIVDKTECDRLKATLSSNESSTILSNFKSLIERNEINGNNSRFSFGDNDKKINSTNINNFINNNSNSNHSFRSSHININSNHYENGFNNMKMAQIFSNSSNMKLSSNSMYNFSQYSSFRKGNINKTVNMYGSGTGKVNSSGTYNGVGNGYINGSETNSSIFKLPRQSSTEFQSTSTKKSSTESNILNSSYDKESIYHQLKLRGIKLHKESQPKKRSAKKGKKEKKLVFNSIFTKHDNVEILNNHNKKDHSGKKSPRDLRKILNSKNNQDFYGKKISPLPTKIELENTKTALKTQKKSKKVAKKLDFNICLDNSLNLGEIGVEGEAPEDEEVLVKKTPDLDKYGLFKNNKDIVDKNTSNASLNLMHLFKQLE